MNPRLAVLAAAALWGTTGTAQALGPPGTSPVAVGAVRILLGAVVLGCLALLLDGRSYRGFANLSTVLGAAAIAAYQACFFAAVARTGVAVGTIVAIGSAPVFTGLLGRAVRSERPERGWGTATLLAIAGASLLVLPGTAAATDPLGIILACGAGLSYAGYTVASKSLLDSGTPPTTTMAVLFAGGGLLLLPVLVVLGPGPVLSGHGVAMALWLGIIATGVAYLLFGRGLAGLRTSTAATLSLAEPLTAGALGLVLLGERPGWLGVAGAGLVLSGLALLSVRPLLTSARPSA